MHVQHHFLSCSLLETYMSMHAMMQEIILLLSGVGQPGAQALGKEASYPSDHQRTQKAPEDRARHGQNLP